MPFIRLAVILAAIAIGVSVVMYLFSRDERYLRFAWRLFQIVAVGLMAFFGLMIAEKLLVAL